MCNDFRNTIPTRAIHDAVNQLKLPLFYPEGAPNIEPREDIRITDRAPLLRASGDGLELVQRRWSWPGPTGKPIYNFRADGRVFNSGRCLIPADGFYEFTAPADPNQKRKDKWLFTMREQPWFCIAAIWRDAPVGEAFAMLTAEPGPDIAPYHDRQIVVLSLDDGCRWLRGGRDEDFLRSAPAGTLDVVRAPAG